MLLRAPRIRTYRKKLGSESYLRIRLANNEDYERAVVRTTMDYHRPLRHGPWLYVSSGQVHGRSLSNRRYCLRASGIMLPSDSVTRAVTTPNALKTGLAYTFKYTKRTTFARPLVAHIWVLI